MDRNGSNLLYYRPLNYGMGYVLPNGTVTNGATTASAPGATPQLNGLSSALTGSPGNGLLPGLTAQPTAAPTTGPGGSFMQKWMIPHLTPSQINFLFKSRMDKKKAQTPVKCDTCNIVLNSEQQAKQHFDGKAHIKKLRKLGLPIPEEHMGKVVGKAGKRRYPCICKDHPDKSTDPDKDQDSANKDPNSSSPEKDDSTVNDPEGSDQPNQKDGSEAPPTGSEAPPTDPDAPPTDPDAPPTDPDAPPTDPDAPPQKKRRFFHRRRWKPYKCEVCNCGNDWEFRNKDSNESSGKTEGNDDGKKSEENDVDGEKDSEKGIDKQDADDEGSNNNNLSTSVIDSNKEGESKMDTSGNNENIDGKSSDTSNSDNINGDKSPDNNAIENKIISDKTSKLTNYLSSFTGSNALLQSQNTERKAFKRDFSGKIASSIETSERNKFSDNSAKINSVNTTIGYKPETDQNGNQRHYAMKKDSSVPNVLNFTKFKPEKDTTGQEPTSSRSSSSVVSTMNNTSVSSPYSVATSPKKPSTSIFSNYTSNTSMPSFASSTAGITKSVFSKSLTSTLPISTKPYMPGKMYPQMPGIGVAAISQKLTGVAGTGIGPQLAAGVPQTTNASLYNGQNLISGSGLLGLAANHSSGSQRHVPLSYQTLPQSQNSIFGLTNGHALNGALSPTSPPFSTTALSLPSVSPQTLYYPTYANSALTEQSYTPVGNASSTNGALNNLYSQYLSTQPIASAMVLSDQTYAVMPSIDLNANQAYTFGCSGSNLSGATLQLQNAFTGMHSLSSQSGGLKGDGSGYQCASGKEPLAISSGYYVDDLNSNNNNNENEEIDNDFDQESFLIDDDFIPSDSHGLKTFNDNRQQNSLNEKTILGGDLNCDDYKCFVNDLVSGCEIEDPVAMVQQPPPEQPDGSKLDPISQAVIDNIQGKLPTKRKMEIPCTVCEVIFNSEAQAQQHFQGSKHAKMAKEVGLQAEATPVSTVPVKRAMFSNEDEFYCEPCQKSFNSAKQLEEHLGSSKHRQSVELPTNCTICNLDFATEEEAIEHYETQEHKDEYSLYYPQTIGEKLREPAQNPSKRRHSATELDTMPVKGVELCCRPCIKSFNSELQLQEHATSKKHRDVIEQPTVCLICVTTFNSETQARAHYESKKHRNKLLLGTPVSEIPEETFPEKAKFSCWLCKKWFNSASQLRGHISSPSHRESVEQPGNCLVCNVFFESEGESQNHYQSMKHMEVYRDSTNVGSARYNCWLCEKFCDTKSQLRQHLNDPKHKMFVEQPLACLVCLKSFTSESQTQVHYQGQKHAAKMKQYREDLLNETPEEMEPAKKQKIENVKKGPMERYSRVPLNLKGRGLRNAMFCEVCQKSFNSESQLSQHLISQKHQAQANSVDLTKSAQGQEGQWQFGTGSNVSDAVKGLFCEVCQKSFNSESQLSQHLISQKHQAQANSGDLTKSSQGQEGQWQFGTGSNDAYRCEICQKSFNSETQMSQHLVSQKHQAQAKGSNGGSSSTPSEQGHWQFGQGSDDNTWQSDSGSSNNLQSPQKMVKQSSENKFGASQNKAGPFKKGAELTIQHSDTKFTKETDGMFKCVCCGVLVNSMVQLAQHYTGSSHKKNAEGWTDQQPQSQPSSTDPVKPNPLVVARPVKPTPENIYRNPSQTKNGTENGFKCGEVEGQKGGWFYCQSCDVSLPTAVTLQLHLQSDYHKTS